MHLQAGALAVSIAGLGRLDVTQGSDKTLQQVVDAAKTLLAADGAGLMLVDEQGALRWATASDSSALTVEAGQERYAQGPCAEAFAERSPVAVDDVIGHHRWREVAKAMTEEGLRAALCVPVDIDNSTIGTLDIYARGPREWDQSEITAAQTYAGLAATLLTNIVAARTNGRLARQLQRALANRVEIEQAKGVLMAREGLSAYDAFARIRQTARSSRRRAIDVARDVLATTQAPAS
jgi:GAF domain-containing protein